MIYIIGGVARSGKTSIRQTLLNRHKISGIETDSLRTLFELALPELGIHYENPPMANAQKMAPFIDAFIRARLFIEEDFVIEGDCLLPKMLQGFTDHHRIKMVFIGYPSIRPEDKLQQLSLEREGWTTHLSDEDLERKTRQFIADSNEFKQQCDEHKMRFIDASLLTLEETVKQALDVLGF